MKASASPSGLAFSASGALQHPDGERGRHLAVAFEPGMLQALRGIQPQGVVLVQHAQQEVVAYSHAPDTTDA